MNYSKNYLNPIYPDLRHVAVFSPETPITILPPETPPLTNHQSSVRSSQRPEVLAGAAIPPVPLHLVERIKSDAFVELADPYTYPPGFRRHHKIKNQASFRC